MLFDSSLVPKDVHIASFLEFDTERAGMKKEIFYIVEILGMVWIQYRHAYRLGWHMFAIAGDS